jgi:hypothetical protein
VEDYYWLLMFAGSQALLLLFGFAVLWTARRRPRTVALAVGGIVAFGLAAVWYWALAFDRGWDAWKGWFSIGMIAVLAGCPAWLLVLTARQPNGGAVGPVGRHQWGQVLFGYWLACWLFTCGLSGLAVLTTTPSGQFR